jgi:hypothetical protein
MLSTPDLPYAFEQPGYIFANDAPQCIFIDAQMSANAAIPGSDDHPSGDISVLDPNLVGDIESPPRQSVRGCAAWRHN